MQCNLLIIMGPHKSTEKKPNLLAFPTTTRLTIAINLYLRLFLYYRLHCSVSLIQTDLTIIILSYQYINTHIL